MTEIIYKELSYAVVGAAMEVHKLLGPGYLESVYQNALAEELRLRNISYEQFRKLPVMYKNKLVGDFEADFVIDNKIILELKAVNELHPRHAAQVANYLAATGYHLAIILNFGDHELHSKRVVR